MKIKIGIVGLGGVGGYFGGMLAKKYNNSATVEVILLSKPNTQKIIQERGLTLELPTQKIIISSPNILSNYNTVTAVDYLFCCVKSYDLVEALKNWSHCISDKTIIIPLLNGVNSKAKIKEIYPLAKVADGCAYIVSKISTPGVISVSSEIKSLYFGSDEIPSSFLENLNKIMLDAEIDSHYAELIKVTLWEKFIFLSSLATATSYLNKTIGQILESENDKKLLLQLIEEIGSLANAQKIDLNDNIVQNTLTKISKLPHQATTSMHNDFKSGKSTEYEILTKHVVKMAKEEGIHTPTFNKIHDSFRYWIQVYI